MRILSILVGFSLLFSSCEDDPVDIAQAIDYFPDEIGNTWIYNATVTDSAGTTATLSPNDTVILLRKDVGQDRFFLETEGYRFGLPNRFTIEAQRILGSGNSVWLDLEAKPKDTIHRIDRTGYSERWVMKPDVVEVLGEMESALVLIRYRTVFNNTFPYFENYELKTWFVKDMGIVRYRSKSISSEWMYDMELVEINLN